MYQDSQFFSAVDGYACRMYRTSMGWKFEFRGAGTCPDETRTKIQNALSLIEKQKDYAGLSRKEFFDKMVSTET